MERFTDLALPDHTGRGRTLSELAGRPRPGTGLSR
jgi:hypothetical protein